MKIVVIVSTVTFVLIFGGLVLLSQVQQKNLTAEQEVLPQLTSDDHAAAERVLRDLALERDRIQREKEEALALQQKLAVDAKVVAQAQATLEEVIGRLQSEQQVYSEEKERSARKLAKMYEAMKPDKAAPILAALDLDVILEIMTRMNERAAAKIMAFMDARLAAQISLRMSIKGAS
jgi:flagellar motility protein MotE (MotC chaperone)